MGQLIWSAQHLHLRSKTTFPTNHLEHEIQRCSAYIISRHTGFSMTVDFSAHVTKVDWIFQKTSGHIAWTHSCRLDGVGQPVPQSTKPAERHTNICEPQIAVCRVWIWGCDETTGTQILSCHRCLNSNYKSGWATLIFKSRHVWPSSTKTRVI